MQESNYVGAGSLREVQSLASLASLPHKRCPEMLDAQVICSEMYVSLDRCSTKRSATRPWLLLNPPELPQAAQFHAHILPIERTLHKSPLEGRLARTLTLSVRKVVFEGEASKWEAHVEKGGC